ncbi:MAG: MoxR family ATPase [Thermaerobacter sp.]|nr:MoxR family ATPase [Thermaerobacter sp.]
MCFLALEALMNQLQRAAWGRRRTAERLLLAVLAEGHILVEDVPGVGKTTLVRALAESLGVETRRIQFTPDLLPSDVTGYTYYEPQSREFILRRGPVFTNLVLADEINRTSPKTQSSLLEAMEERQVTIDGEVHELPWPFVVCATENPIEYEGTFPLPEAQLDRFLVRLRLGYPDAASETEVLMRPGGEQRAERLSQAISLEELRAAVDAAQAVLVGEPIARYALAVAERTRSHQALLLGLSPRGTIAWVRAARALAFLRGETFVTPDHLRDLAHDVACHRLVVRPEPAMRGVTAQAVLDEVLSAVPLPGVRAPVR